MDTTTRATTDTTHCEDCWRRLNRWDRARRRALELYSLVFRRLFSGWAQPPRRIYRAAAWLYNRTGDAALCVRCRQRQRRWQTAWGQGLVLGLCDCI